MSSGKGEPIDPGVDTAIEGRYGMERRTDCRSKCGIARFGAQERSRSDKIILCLPLVPFFISLSLSLIVPHDEAGTHLASAC